MKLYDYMPCHNCYRVRLLLAMLGLAYVRQNVDLSTGENKLPEFLKLNPRGQVPVLEDQGVLLWDSAAILVYLGRRHGHGRWLPDDAEGMARVSQWLAVAQNEILLGLGRALWIKRGGKRNLEEALARAQQGLRIMESRLTIGPWLAADHPTIADIACYPHVAVAPAAGISLDEYPRLTEWIKAIESLPGYVPMLETGE